MKPRVYWYRNTGDWVAEVTSMGQRIVMAQISWVDAVEVALQFAPGVRPWDASNAAPKRVSRWGDMPGIRCLQEKTNG